MDLQLKGLKAIVTGGTKGIGLAIARTFAAEGADVAIRARDDASVESTASALAELSGARAPGVAVDVPDGDAPKAWVGRVGAQWGIDIVVANVSALAIGNDIESWRKEFETDLLGTANLVDAAIPFLEVSRAASIILISSVSGREIDFAAGRTGSSRPRSFTTCRVWRISSHGRVSARIRYRQATCISMAACGTGSSITTRRCSSVRLR